ncbi:MAG: ATP-binding protein, partial [Bacteroidota bacterium]
PTEVINIAEIIKEARLSLPPSYQGLCRKIFTYDLPPFRANRRKMLLMVQQILLFSIKNRGEEPLSIEVSSKPIDCPYTGEPEFLFSFQDNGASIPKDKREEVFHLQTFRGNTNALHLGISKKILHIYSGHLWLDPDCDTGNIVHLVLPLSKVGIAPEEHPKNAESEPSEDEKPQNLVKQLAERVNLLFLGL